MHNMRMIADAAVSIFSASFRVPVLFPLSRICAAVTAVCSFAVQAQTISFDEIVRLADVSAQERNAAQAAIAVRRAEAAVQMAQSAFEWNHAGGVTWRRQLEYVDQGGTLSSTTIYRWNLSSSLGFDRLLENGIRVQPALLLQKNASGSTSLLGSQSALPSITVDVPLNGGLGNSIEKMRLDAARRGKELATLDVDVARQATIAQATRLAWGWLAAKRRLEAAEAQEAEADATARRVSELVARGEVAPIVKVQTDARLIGGRLETVRLRNAESAVRSELAYLLGPASAERLRAVAMEDRFPEVVTLPDPVALTRLAQERRADMIKARERVEQARIGLRIADRQVATKVSLVMTYESVALGWSTPLGQSRNQAIQHDAVSEMEQAELALAEMNRRLAFDMEALVLKMSQLRQALVELRKVEDEQRRIATALMRGVTSGAGSIQLQAATDASNARVQTTLQIVATQQAIADAIVELRLATGQIPATPGDIAAKVSLFRSVQ